MTTVVHIGESENVLYPAVGGRPKAKMNYVVVIIGGIVEPVNAINGQSRGSRFVEIYCKNVSMAISKGIHVWATAR
jgi:hypothetical protein